jgi:hypothetical protein
LVSFAVDLAHVIRVGDAYSKGDAFDGSPIFLILKLLNIILITLKSLTRELYPSPFV